MKSDLLKNILADCELDSNSPHPPAVQKALFLARRLQERATELQTAPEKRQQAELDRMLQTPSDKATLAQITDQAFRTNDPHRAVEHLIHILDVQGVPRFFGPVDRTLMKGFQSFGSYLPGVALPLVKEHMQKETANVILPGEKELLVQHLAERTREGVRMNVNFLGEAILSEAEAEKRLQQYLQGLQWPETEVVSIKISTLYSQISALAREHTVAMLCDRLERLFLTADRARFTRPDGEVVPKFVYLDMEEYRDKELTAEAFMRTLDRAGPEAHPGGHRVAGLHSRLVRHAAANSGLGAASASPAAAAASPSGSSKARTWKASAPRRPCAAGRRRRIKTKLETDANYKRMVHELLKPENLAAMNVGIASHNLFDLAYALVLAHERKRARPRAV